MIKYWIVDRKGNKHGYCLTRQFAKKCCGIGEVIVAEKRARVQL